MVQADWQVLLIVFLLTLGSIIVVQYYKGRNNVILDNTGKLIQFTREEFRYTGGDPIFVVNQSINSVLYVEINGLAEQEGVGYEIYSVDTTNKTVVLLGTPQLNSDIGISYLY